MKQQFTKSAIKQSLLKLVEQRPIEKITVRDIVEDCELTRNTFYYYYDDVYDVIDEILHDKIKTFLECGCSDDEQIENEFISIIEFFTQDPKIVRHIFNTSRRDEMRVYVVKSADTIMNWYFDKVKDGRTVSDKDKKIICGFCRSAVVGYIEDWVRNGMSDNLTSEIRRGSELFREVIENAIDNSSQFDD